MKPFCYRKPQIHWQNLCFWSQYLLLLLSSEPQCHFVPHIWGMSTHWSDSALSKVRSKSQSRLETLILAGFFMGILDPTSFESTYKVACTATHFTKLEPIGSMNVSLDGCLPLALTTCWGLQAVPDLVQKLNGPLQLSLPVPKQKPSRNQKGKVLPFNLPRSYSTRLNT